MSEVVGKGINLRGYLHTSCLKQDGAEYGSRVASSEKTFQFFVCFISFFVVLSVLLFTCQICR